MPVSNRSRFSVNGGSHGEKKDQSLPDRQHKANEAVAGTMDQINELLAETEKLLKAHYHPTQDTSVPYQESDWDNSEWQFCSLVGFIKYEVHGRPGPATWRICYRSFEENVISGNECRNDTGWKLLADCPRRLRADVVSAFPKLLPELQAKIVTGTEELVVQAANAKEALKKALASLQSTLNQA